MCCHHSASTSAHCKIYKRKGVGPDQESHADHANKHSKVVPANKAHLEEEDGQQDHAGDGPRIQQHGRQQGRVGVCLNHEVVALNINQRKQDVYLDGEKSQRADVRERRESRLTIHRQSALIAAESAGV